MLDDRERKLLIEIERRLLAEEPELSRSFGARPPHGPGARHHAGAITKVAGLTLCAVLLLGPRPLTLAEVATRSTTGPPRVTPTSPGTPIPAPRRPLPTSIRAEFEALTQRPAT